MLAFVMDSVLALNSATSQEACDFILLYILLKSIFISAAFQYQLWANIILIIVHFGSVQLLCTYLDLGDYMPSI